MGWTIDGVKPTYRCNSELLRFYRGQRKWTQEELGQRAGYSRRLISKAESGLSISSQTVADLAQVLSTSGDPLYPEDLICDPIELAKRFTAALYVDQKNAMDKLRHFLSEDVEFRVPGDPAEIPFAGVYRGHDGIEQFVALFFQVLEVPEGHDHTEHYEYIGSGNEVVCWGQSWAHPIGQPLTTPVDIAMRFVFQRGKLVDIEDRFDQKVGAEALARKKATSE